MTVDTSCHILLGMKLHYRETEDLLWIDKPDGIATHAVDHGHEALVEKWQRLLDQPLWVVHRLDKTTSGAMVFAKNKVAAERLRQNFVNKQVEKTYWFLTDRQSHHLGHDEHLEVTSEISKEGSGFVNRPDSPSANATTRFTRIKRNAFFELWSASPLTGKPHQIRLHAAQAGLHILGDVTYGGTPFPRLCLHAVELKLPGEATWMTPAPRLFERLGLLRDAEISQALIAIDRRQRWFHFTSQRDECLRLIEFECPGIQLDLLGSQCWLNWFREQEPKPRDLERWSLVARILGKPINIQMRWNRGARQGPAPKWTSQSFLPLWTARENQVLYEFRLDSGESHGLFLDQRDNRKKIAELSRGHSLLNLFAYTGGFGVAAALNGAKAITTVDLSGAAIDWAKHNFSLNNIAPECQLEFFTADSFFFLERAKKKGRKWDVIVCDPPIFSRGERVFKIEKNWLELIDLCRAVLSPKGTLFLSTHFEQWTADPMIRGLKKKWPQARVEMGTTGLDVPSPPSHLKSFLIRF